MSKNKKEAEKLGVSLTGDFGPVKVPKGKYFVMGDNRLNSMDSRNGLGLIAEDRIVGTSKFVFFPFNEMSNKIKTPCWPRTAGVFILKKKRPMQCIKP